MCDAAGTCTQEFQHGQIVIPKAGSAYVLDKGPIGTKYLAVGGPSGVMGYPVGAVVSISGSNGDGLSQAFVGGQILSSADGVFLLRNPMWKELAKYAWVRGPLGWPVADQVCDAAGTCTQEFQHGKITLGPAGTVVSYH